MNRLPSVPSAESEKASIASERMRIAGAPSGSGLRVLHTLSGLQVGGIARLLLRNIGVLRSRGVENHVAYLSPRHNLEEAFCALGVDPICLEHSRTLDAPRTITRLVRLIRDLEPDVVHTNHLADRLYVGLAARIAGVPAVTTLHDTFRVPPGKLPRLSAWAIARLYSRYIAVSRSVAEVHVESRGVSPRLLHVVYSGLDPSEIRPSSVRKSRTNCVRRELGLDDSVPLLINVARLTSAKGHALLIPMMERLRSTKTDAALLIVGDGEERERLEASIEQAGLQRRIRLLGYRDDVDQLLSAATIFLFPSCRGEGLPMAVVEAMFAAKPIIASATGPLREMVESGKNGQLVKVGSPRSMADAVQHLLNDSELLASMGSQSRKLAGEKFRIDLTVDQMMSIYRQVMETP